MINHQLTYVSLFSSAGVGCYGLKQVGMECIATNELLARRLNIQKINAKCTLATGYIGGDITTPEVEQQIYTEIHRWQQLGNDCVDLVIATPPCQGMSVANHKKKPDEINRNSLIVASVNIVAQIQPRCFVFENVAAFWKTGCHYQGEVLAIGEMITQVLGSDYTIEHRILNFKNYGSNSSRTRTLVIGVHKSLAAQLQPAELFLEYRAEPTLGEVIGDLPELEWGEYDPQDFYHSFRVYPEHMRAWIKDLEQGQSAFDNAQDWLKPHKVVDGQIVINQAKNGDKYRRQILDKVAPCIHTRNDQMASQNTLHPTQDRVFSIRELMLLMTIPSEFKWVDASLAELNALSLSAKRQLSKKEEMNIRQSIGEAVPTAILRQIGAKLQQRLQEILPRPALPAVKATSVSPSELATLDTAQITKLIKEHHLSESEKLRAFVEQNLDTWNFTTLSRIIELANAQRESYSAFYTSPEILDCIIAQLPEFTQDEIHILEPSVGMGNFLPLLFAKYAHLRKIHLTVVDIDAQILELLELIFAPARLPANVEISFMHADYLSTLFTRKFDLLVGNPPFTKLKTEELQQYRALKSYSSGLTNAAGLFLEKALDEAHHVSLILPKNLLNTPEYTATRAKLQQSNIHTILDFGEAGFKGVLIETINISFGDLPTSQVLVRSIPRKVELLQPKEYIFDARLPYWIIYRDANFDAILNKMQFGIFEVFRDRQITNAMLSSQPQDAQSMRVLKSRNISDDGKSIINIANYDAFISTAQAQKLAVYKFKDADDVYLTPNMTYKPRLHKKEQGYITNGSIAILTLKEPLQITEQQMAYIATAEFRNFYAIARNYQTRSLNIDNSSVYWFGINKEA